MTEILCPSCQTGKIYEKKQADGFTTGICFACGYYEDDSEGFRLYPVLIKSLFRDGFKKRTGWGSITQRWTALHFTQSLDRALEPA